MAKFIKGLELSRLYFEQVVQPIIANNHPDLRYAAALIGRGSEVLGFDDEMSTDHDWGPSLILFLQPADSHLRDALDTLFSASLPSYFMSYPTHFTPPDEEGVQVMEHCDNSQHRIVITTVKHYFYQLLGWYSDHTLEIIDWLTFPSQKLRAITSGDIFHDGLGDLSKIRDSLAWYPHDIWLYMMAVQWARIGEEEHLMARAGYRSDEIGATLIAGRLINDMMRLSFLMEKQYAPYPKWFGTAFAQLDCAETLMPLLRRMQLAEGWQYRQSIYAKIVAFQIEKQVNLLDLADISLDAQQFHDRPFLVANAERIVSAILAKITDSDVRRLLELPSLIGSIDQFTDHTGLREASQWRAKIMQLYKR